MKLSDLVNKLQMLAEEGCNNYKIIFVPNYREDCKKNFLIDIDNVHKLITFKITF